MANKLVILESPNKIKAVKGYLGKNFKVIASQGHVRDLPKSALGIDIENGFAPKYINIRGKGELIKNLKAEAKKADTVYLATDPDREGEAISWHLTQVLELDESKTKRIRFNEVTENAVQNAVKNPTSLNMDLVDAQQTRRILDRIVGYQLSPILWKKIKSGLSAGRVQSVATRLIVDRENEIRAFKADEYWTVDAMLKTADGKKFKASYAYSKNKLELSDESKANAILDKIKGRDFTVSDVKRSERYKNPQPPFITSTLQQEAYRRLGFSSSKTMKTAQELYEGISLGSHGTHGIITYMRTDSLHVSTVALDSAEQYIKDVYGAEYYPEKRRFYKSKNGAQDAHEAIRPSYMNYPPKDIKQFLSSDQYKLYSLIWDRFLASQMASAVLDTVTIDTECGGVPFRSSGYTVKFNGYTVLYDYKSEEKSDDDSEKDNILPAVKTGEVLKCAEIIPAQHFTQPPARFSEGTLIKALEEKGIGRPSTFAPTITTIIQRGYVERDAKTLAPTSLGEVTTKLMCDNFKEIVDYDFTANMENFLDDIESGKKDMLSVLTSFYNDFEKELSDAQKNINRENYKLPVVETDIICEKCGSKMVIKSGRFGKFAACPNYPACKNTKTLDKNGNPVAAGAKATSSTPAPENIKCDICGGPMVIRRGRYGQFYACASYPKCNGTKPITKELDVKCPLCSSPLTIRHGKNRTTFYSCSSYPKCKFTSCDVPTNEKCPECGGMLLRKRGKDNVYVCVNKTCAYNEKNKKSK
ncbi:MAG: type I DNA topoisomerase [Clostridiales bacterium]|nr:type I DNA topoisomerase [Clostridiales bacterium]